MALALAFGVGLFIFLVYKKTYQGVMYSSSFGVHADRADDDHDAGHPRGDSRTSCCRSAWSARCPSSASARRSRNRWTSRSCSGRLRRASCWLRASFRWRVIGSVDHRRDPASVRQPQEPSRIRISLVLAMRGSRRREAAATGYLDGRNVALRQSRARPRRRGTSS